MADKAYILNANPNKFPVPQEKRENEWHAGLCGCFGDCAICCFAHYCFCCLVSQNSADLDGNPNSMGCCYPAHIAKNRLQAEAQFGIRSNLAWDIFVCCFFPFCSEIQVAREIKWHRENVKPAPSIQMMAMSPGPAMLMMSPGVGASPVLMQSPNAAGGMTPMMLQMHPATPQNQQIAYQPVYQQQQQMYSPQHHQPMYQQQYQQPPNYAPSPQHQQQQYIPDPNQQPQQQQWPTVDKPQQTSY